MPLLLAGVSSECKCAACDDEGALKGKSAGVENYYGITQGANGEVVLRKIGGWETNYPCQTSLCTSRQ